MGYKRNPTDYTIKAHVITPITTVVIDTWTDFTGFTIIDDETTGSNIVLDDDTTTFNCNKTGLYKFGGCIHYIDGTGSSGLNDLTILSRILHNGTTEARCSQRGKTQDIRAGGEDVLSYNGTIYLEDGDTLTLQYYTNETNLDFTSSDNFDTQVSCTLWLNYGGK